MSKNMEVSLRLKKAREYLNLSRDYVGNLIGLNGLDILQIENGARNISESEMKIFSKVYGWSVDELLYGSQIQDAVMFARAEKLTDEDRSEIMSLLRLKRKLRDKNSESI